MLFKFLNHFKLNTKKQFSIITPTFNQSQYLPRIFDCLSQQNDVDIEWIIVDDGSSDNTKEIVSSFEKNFVINYIKQTPIGKPTAMNIGLEQANSHITLVLDNGYVLPDNILGDIWNYYDITSGKFKKDCACVAGLCKYDNGEIVGKKFPRDFFISDHIRFIANNNIAGDKCLFYVTEILKQYPYPIFHKERYITPNIIHSRIALSHNTLYTNQIFMKKQFAKNDSQARNLWIANPLGSELYYNEISLPPFRLNLQIKHISEYIFFAKLNRKKNIYANTKNKKLFPLGLIFYFTTKIKFNLKKNFLFQKMYDGIRKITVNRIQQKRNKTKQGTQ